MKKLLTYFFLVFFTFLTSSHAKDVTDYEINGVSIGQSLLDYLSKDEIFAEINNFSAVMVKMTAHIFPTYANRDQRRYIQKYLRKPPEMKVRTFSTRLLQLNAYLAFSLLTAKVK